MADTILDDNQFVTVDSICAGPSLKFEKATAAYLVISRRSGHHSVILTASEAGKVAKAILKDLKYKKQQKGGRDAKP